MIIKEYDSKDLQECFDFLNQYCEGTTLNDEYFYYCVLDSPFCFYNRKYYAGGADYTIDSLKGEVPGVRLSARGSIAMYLSDKPLGDDLIDKVVSEFKSNDLTKESYGVDDSVIYWKGVELRLKFINNRKAIIISSKDPHEFRDNIEGTLKLILKELQSGN